MKKIILAGVDKTLSFEYQLFSVANKLAIINVYRPPAGSMKTFMEELGSLLSICASTLKQPLFLCGDLNCPGEGGSVGEKLSDMFDEVGFKQMVAKPTRDHNILDIIALPEEHVGLVSEVNVEDLGSPFDHRLVSCKINIKTVLKNSC